MGLQRVGMYGVKQADTWRLLFSKMICVFYQRIVLPISQTIDDLSYSHISGAAGVTVMCSLP